MYELLWFFGGALLYAALSKLILLGQATIFLREIQAHSLIYLVSTEEDMSFFRTLKYQNYREIGISESEINSLKEIDKITIDMWKKTAVSKFNSTLPPRFNGLKIKNWNEASKLVKSLTKMD
tara:strand:- start:52 stop:417 length:366 start_codon:yes stop_codon:yes gene_type:complete